MDSCILEPAGSLDKYEDAPDSESQDFLSSISC